MKYTDAHEWIKVEGDEATVGITDYAQKELGDIVYVELPVEGHAVKRGDEVIVLESTKAAIDIYTPLSGEITAGNTALREYPERVNKDAEGEGWLFKLRIADRGELEGVMDGEVYNSYVKNRNNSESP